jgi:hypothetical protein
LVTTAGATTGASAQYPASRLKDANAGVLSVADEHDGKLCEEIVEKTLEGEGWLSLSTPAPHLRGRLVDLRMQIGHQVPATRGH